MLKRYRSFVFLSAFLVALLVLLAFTLEVHRLIDGFGTPRHENSALSNAWRALFFSGYFLVMSGYLFTFTTSYIFFTRKWARPLRAFANSFLFLASYVFFSILLGHGITFTWGALLTAGILSVLLADAFAEKLAPGAVPRDSP